MSEIPGAGWVIQVPGVPLPAGWNKAATAVKFIAHPAYPYANLDCFWADCDLRLNGGNIPQNAQAENPIPGTNDRGLWFSWHLQQPWNPNRDDFNTWVAVIKQRFAQLR